jgi:hypothetical protein
MDIAFQVFFEGFFAWLVFLCVVAIVLAILGAVWMYRDAESRRMDAIVWVILLVVATVFANLLGFIIVLVVYLLVRESHPIGGGMPYGYGAAGYPPFPAACPVCGNPMSWYPQYARWYCPTCGQYR